MDSGKKIDPKVLSEERIKEFLKDGEVDLPSIQSLFVSKFETNLKIFEEAYQKTKSEGRLFYHRTILSPIDRVVDVWDDAQQKSRSMLMFGSNSYLGIANDPYVKQRVSDMIHKFGVGMGGPMLLNGTSRLHREAEERLAALKGKQDAILIPTGYMTNLAWITSLMSAEAVLLYDEVSHASIVDGVTLGRKKAYRFAHNDVADLKEKLKKFRSGKNSDRDIFVTTQGVYSMNGELAPLNEIAPLCQKYNAHLVVDDAHGTGVMGGGRGTSFHFGVDQSLRFAMGTFSKAFSVTGGFFAGDKESINFLRFFSRPYFFSASLSPLNVAVVLAALDLLEKEPERVKKLHENAAHLRKLLTERGINFLPTESAIIPIFPSNPAHFRSMAAALNNAGVFVNSIEAPGVRPGFERFRVTVMSTHTFADIERLVDIFSEVFEKFK